MLKAVRIFAILLAVTLILPLVFSLAGTGPAEAICYNTVYVDASRPDDLGDGLTWATAKKYIQSGITVACKPGTVYVAAGVYNHPGSNTYEIAWLNDNLTLIGAGALTTFIDGNNLYRGISVTSHPGQVNTIRGFTIRNGSGPHLSGKLMPAFTSYAAGIGISFPGLRPQMFNGDQSAPDGGGVFITDEHRVTIEDCAIIDNRGRNGGGIYNSGQLTMNRCTVANNTAYGQGGGIYMQWQGPPAATLEMTNCTVSGNTATGALYGGGIYCGTQMRLINCTIADNSVTGPMSVGGGFANLSPTTAYFKNCIVANNVANSVYNNGYSDPPSGVVSEGNNIDSRNNCYFDEPTDQVNTNPQLGPLQNNGGPTSTHAITSGGPAYNRGTSAGAPATDQRGVARPQAGAYDIGAYELLYVAPPPPTVNPLIGTGSHGSSVGGSTGTVSTTYGFNPPVTNPVIQTQSASLSSKTVTPGTPVTVTADIINKSSVNGSKKVTLYVNGQVESTQGITVNSGGSTKLTFNVSRSEPGDYSVYVDGVPAGSFKVELFRESDGILVFSVALVALAFLIGMVMLWRRQQHTG